MKEKMEKDISIAKRNRQVILTTGILVFIVAVIYLISMSIGGAFYDFCKAALSWVLIGIGVACASAYVKTDK